MKTIFFMICMVTILGTAVMAQKRRSIVVKPTQRTSSDAVYDGKRLYKNGKLEESVAYFKEAMTLDPDNPDPYLYLGLLYGVEEQYPNAVEMLDGYLKKHVPGPSDVRVHHSALFMLEYAKQRPALLDMKPAMKEPERLANPINTEFEDYMPVLDATGKKLYFTSRRQGGISMESSSKTRGDEDLYFIERIGNTWSQPALLPEPVNSVENDAAASFSADGQMMVYTACGRPEGMGGCDLYTSTLDGNQWSNPVNLGNVVNSEKWDSQPTISFDGSRIIFASGRPGGYGEEDLYMIERNLFGEWGPAMNLGGVVNTPFDDESPFLSQDGKTLYFASKGHPGYGGYDMFKTTYDNGKWSNPVNLGRPLNTAGEDRFFTIGGSGEIGYIASDRIDGQLDLFEVEIPEAMRPQPTVVITGIVTNAKTNEKVGAYVMVEDINTGELIAVNKSNAVTGKYVAVLPSGRTYSVSANKQAFFFYSQSFDVPLTARYQEINKDIALKPIEKGAKVIINNIFFETGKATLSPKSRLELEKAIDLMKTNPTMVIEVGGHTDNTGDDASNMKLSHDRARAVLAYLVNGGIAINRLQAKGYGELNPVASNDSDEGRQTNRRTEFVILEF